MGYNTVVEQGGAHANVPDGCCSVACGAEGIWWHRHDMLLALSFSLKLYTHSVAEAVLAICCRGCFLSFLRRVAREIYCIIGFILQ